MIKEIEQKYDMWADDYNLTPQEVEWLIEQAERAQDYKTAYEIVDMLARSTIDKANELKQQNKRYREALEFYADKENYRKTYDSFSDTGHSETVVQQDAGKKARNVLRSD